MPLPKKGVVDHLYKDPVLRIAIDAVQIDSPTENIDVFEYLIRSIVSQQLSVKSARSIYNRLMELENINSLDPESFLRYDDDSLRKVGLSYQKARYVKNVCSFFLNKGLLNDDWNKYADDEIISLLTQIKGVGIWTVQMVLMFGLNRPDIFPDGDLGIQQGMVKLYDIEEEKKEMLKKMRSIANQWSPYRTTASLYIWKYKDQSKKSNDVP